MHIVSNYRILLDSDFKFLPEFIVYLQNKFKELVYFKLHLALNVDVTTVIYHFTLTTLPNSYAPAVNEIRKGVKNEDSEAQEAEAMLQSLDPMNPQPVELDLTLQEIIDCVCKTICYFEVPVGRNINRYFGIPDYAWFNLIPLYLYDVMERVDLGGTDAPALHLFDWVFDEIQTSLLDYYLSFFDLRTKELMIKNTIEPEIESEGETDADV